MYFGLFYWITKFSTAQLDDSGRYGAIATNPAGRAETLADVMVTQLIMDESPQTHKIVFTDVTDETKVKMICIFPFMTMLLCTYITGIEHG